MNIELARAFFLWCMVVNYVLLMVWFLAFAFAHDWMHHLHGRWFRLSRERFDAAHYTVMAIYKVAIIMFTVVPLIVLYIVD
jgi:hypothetical protein